MSEFFMSSCNCKKSENGCWMYDCCAGKCNECKDKRCPEIPNLSDDTLKYHVFEITHKEYISSRTKEKKTSSRTERVEKEMSSIELYKIISSKTKQYTTHRYQIENDKFVFPKIYFRKMCLVLLNGRCRMHIFQSNSTHFIVLWLI